MVKRTVGSKLWVGFLSILAIMLMIGVASLWSLTKMDHGYRKLIDFNMNRVILLEQLLSNQNDNSNSIRGFLLFGEEIYIEERNDLILSFNQKLKELTSIYGEENDLILLYEIKEAALSYKEITEFVISESMEGNDEKAMKLASE